MSLLLLCYYALWYWATVEEKKDIIKLMENCNLFFDTDDYKKLAWAFSEYVDIQKESKKNCWIDYANKKYNAKGGYLCLQFMFMFLIR